MTRNLPASVEDPSPADGQFSLVLSETSLSDEYTRAPGQSGGLVLAEDTDFAGIRSIYSVRRRLHMHTTAIAVAILTGTFLSIFLSILPLFLSGERGNAAQEKARVRRMAEHRMNARLLRLNL